MQNQICLPLLRWFMHTLNSVLGVAQGMPKLLRIDIKIYVLLVQRRQRPTKWDKLFIDSVFQTRKSRGGRSAIGWQAVAPACQPVAVEGGRKRDFKANAIE